jgi:hypothetical protein
VNKFIWERKSEGSRDESENACRWIYFKKVRWRSSRNHQKGKLFSMSRVIRIIAEILFILCLINNTRISLRKSREIFFLCGIEIKYSILLWDTPWHAGRIKWDFYALYTWNVSQQKCSQEVNIRYCSKCVKLSAYANGSSTLF